MSEAGPPDVERRILYPLAAAVILAYFLLFTSKSLALYFDQDDMMNLYLAWSKPLGQVLKANLFFGSDVVRPLGAEFYRCIYALAGFNPLPFRIACLAIGIANLALCFWCTRLLSGSERVAALATLLFAFHPRLIEVWYRTAVIYDLMCFTFFYLAGCLYISTRQRGAFPSARRSLAILLCYICALDSKEVAVALPLILLGYEILFTRAHWRKLWLIALLAALNVPYIVGKTYGSNALTNNPFYRPEYSWSRFANSWALYLNYLVMKENQIGPGMALGILGALFLGALAFRSRKLLLSWCIILLATLPVSFLPYRGGFVLYLSYLGWVLYSSLILVALQDALLRSWPQYRTALACLVFVLVGWRFGKLSLHDLRVDPKPWLYDGPKLVHDMADQMRILHPTLPQGARTLFLEDSFPVGEWTPYFIMKLLYHDQSMLVDRVKMMDKKPADWNQYQYVFTYDAGIWGQLKP